MASSSGLITNLLYYLRLKRQHSSTKNKKQRNKEKMFNANNDANYEQATITTTKNEKNKVHSRMKISNNNNNNNDSSRKSSTTSTATTQNYFC
jgi:hypothetical protein